MTTYHKFPSGSRCISADYQATIPEAKDVCWTDDFFDDDEDTIAVFDFDYEQMKDFTFKLEALVHTFHVLLVAGYSYALFDFYGPLVCVGIFPLYLVLLRYQVQWKSEANHLAITRDGIRSVQDKQKRFLGWSMCDKGKHSKTVPFDKITDCDLVDPAGNSCCIIPNVLYVVNVDTASSGGGGKQYELRIAGLRHPEKFKALVWAMKRQRDNNLGGAYKAPPPQLEMTERNQQLLSGGSSDTSVKTLLKDIRTELRENNDLLRKIHGSNPVKLDELMSGSEGELV